MILYQRNVTKRVAINKYGKLGFKKFTEYVRTNDISKYNKGLQIKFEVASSLANKKYSDLPLDYIECEPWD